MKKEKKSFLRRFLKSPFFSLLLWMLVGVGFWIVFPSYRYTAFLFWGYAGIRGGYLLLNLLGRKKPRLGKALKITFTVCLCLLLLAGIVTQAFLISGAKGEKEPESPYVLVLGAGVNGTVPSRTLASRLRAAQAYLEAYPEAVCIVSGGQGSGENITEAQCMYTWLTSRGIAPERIWQEDKATSTEENIAFTLALIREKTGSLPEEMAVISSEFHLFRAGLMAQEQGFQMLGVPARTTPMPLRVHYYFREMLALWKYLVF